MQLTPLHTVFLSRWKQNIQFTEILDLEKSVDWLITNLGFIFNLLLFFSFILERKNFKTKNKFFSAFLVLVTQLKGTVNDPAFKERFFLFTTVPLNTLYDQKLLICQRFLNMNYFQLWFFYKSGFRISSVIETTGESFLNLNTFQVRKTRISSTLLIR